jgi:hypothetical protein
VTDIFEERSITIDIIIIIGISDLCQRIFKHIIINIQLVKDEVHIEYNTYDGGYKALG